MRSKRPKKMAQISSMIMELRGQKIMLDRDLADLYQVKTRHLKQAVKRNKKKFPSDFLFRLSKKEIDNMVSHFVIPSRSSFGGARPYAFTRNGANMLATVLKSSVATRRSIQIMRAFSALEEAISRGKKMISESPDILEKLSVHSRAIMQLFQSNKAQNIKTDKLQEIQKDMTSLLQQIIINSLKDKQ